MNSTRLSRLSSFLPSLAQLRAAPVLAALAAVPMLSHFLSHGHTDQRLLQLAFIAMAALWIVLRRPGRADPVPLSRKGMACIAVFFAAGLCSSLFALAPRFALMEVALFLSLFLIALAGAREIAADYAATLSVVLSIVGIGCLLYVFQSCVILATALLTGTQPDPMSFAPGFSNQRFFNHAQTVTLPLLILLACREDNVRAKYVWLAVAAYWWALLFSSAGKATFVALVSAAVLTGLIMRGRAVRFLSLLLGTAIGGLAVLGLLFVLVPQLLGLKPFLFLANTGLDGAGLPSANMRFLMWERCIKLIQEAPWLGIGPMHYAQQLLVTAHPHSWLFQIGAEWGIPALLAWCAAIATGCAALLGRLRHIAIHDHSNQAVATGLIVTGIALLVDGLLSGQLVMPVSQLLIALYLACAIGWVRSMRPPLQVSTPPRTALAARLLALIAAAGLIGAVAPDFKGTEAPGSVNNRQFSDTHWPRFWEAQMF